MKRARRILVWTLASLLSLVVIIYLGAVGFMTMRESELVYPGAYRTGGVGLAVQDSTGASWDTLRVAADDGVRVFLLDNRLPAGSHTPWILYFHGNGGHVGSREAIRRYRIFHELGFDVLAVEYRGYGESRGTKPSEAGVYADARAGWKYLTGTLRVDPGRIVIYGWSLGSGVATNLAAEVRPAGLITEGTFTSLPAVGHSLYPWLPTRLIMRNRFDNLSKANRVQAPWLLLHGRHDQEVPFQEAEHLASAGAAHARLVPLDAGHDVLLGDRSGAEAALRTFADSVLGVPAPGSGAGGADVTPGATSDSTARSGGPTPAASRR